MQASKSLLEIDSKRPEFVKVLEVEEWFELHKKLDTVRLQEKINFLRTQFNKYKVLFELLFMTFKINFFRFLPVLYDDYYLCFNKLKKNREDKAVNKELRMLGFDIFSLSFENKLAIMFVVLIMLISLFFYLYSMVNKDRSRVNLKKKKNN